MTVKSNSQFSMCCDSCLAFRLSFQTNEKKVTLKVLQSKTQVVPFDKASPRIVAGNWESNCQCRREYSLRCRDGKERVCWYWSQQLYRHRGALSICTQCSLCLFLQKNNHILGLNCSLTHWEYLPHCNGNSVYIFLFQEQHGLSPNFHTHVSLNDLYIPRISLHISSSRRGRPIVGIYNSLTDT